METTQHNQPNIGLLTHKSGHFAMLLATALLVFGILTGKPSAHAQASAMESLEPPFSDGKTDAQRAIKLANQGVRFFSKAEALFARVDSAKNEREKKNIQRQADEALESATERLRAAAKLDQRNYSTFTALGRALAASDDTRRAVGAYNFALQLNSKYYDAWYHRALALLELGLYDEVKKSHEVLARNEALLATRLREDLVRWRQDAKASEPVTSDFADWIATL